MRGTYVLKENGRILSVSKNLITTAGRKEIMRFLAGERAGLAHTLGVGVGEKTPSLLDTDLDLEFEKTPVTLGAPLYTESQIVYKGLLSATSVGRIYEMGIWSSSTLDSPLRNILTFDDRFEDWSTGTWTSLNARLGAQTLLVGAATNTTVATTLTNWSQSLVDYSNADTFILSFFVGDANCDSVTIEFQGETATNRYEYTNTNIVEGYNILRFSKNDLGKYGTVDYNQVVRVVLSVKSNTTDAVRGEELDPLGYTGTRVYFDKLSVRVKNLEVSTNTLISRSLLSGPQQKRAGTPMEVEYYLELSI